MTFLLSIALYVFGALGYYSIAQRRGIRHAWLAWVPIGNMWLLGCISDQYQSVAKGKQKNKRRALLILSLILMVLLIVMIVLLVLFIVQVSADVDHSMPPMEDMGSGYEFEYEYGYGETEDIPAAALGAMLGMIASYFALFGVAIAVSVLEYMALYDLYHSCDPDNSVLFLLLSIFLGIAPFLVFACREKDLGMPPRVPPQPPVYGYQMPVYGQPLQPPVPPAEPWKQNEQ